MIYTFRNYLYVEAASRIQPKIVRTRWQKRVGQISVGQNKYARTNRTDYRSTIGFGTLVAFSVDHIVNGHLWRGWIQCKIVCSGFNI